MTDVVVTVPKSFGFEHWLAEGDLPGEEWSGQDSFFWLGGYPPKMSPGERVYIVFNGKLRGYAPLLEILRERGSNRFALVRRGGAVAVTIPEFIKGFRGWRYRWWFRELEVPFPEWKEP